LNPGLIMNTCDRPMDCWENSTVEEIPFFLSPELKTYKQYEAMKWPHTLGISIVHLLPWSLLSGINWNPQKC